MSMTDPIADMLTRIRNGSTARHSTVEIPASKMKAEIARLMTEQGYIAGYDKKQGEQGEVIIVELKYAKKETLPKVLGGLGTAIISTSRGLVTSAEAQKLGLGGEVICFIW